MELAFHGCVGWLVGEKLTTFFRAVGQTQNRKNTPSCGTVIVGVVPEKLKPIISKTLSNAMESDLGGKNKKEKIRIIETPQNG